MKIMSCKQLGGACDKEFHAKSFDEIAEMSKQHGMEMFKKNDEAHLKAMHEMQQLMQNPDAMAEWFESKKENLLLYLRARNYKALNH
jgi:predicted small metal-binding protein